MNIVFDLDSTLTTIEGIDELAALKGIKKEVAGLTNEAMNGNLSLEEVFLKRLELIRPNKADLELIGEMYLSNVTENAESVVAELKKQGHNVFIVTGGYKIPTQLVADKLGINTFFSNQVIFNQDGSYKGLNKSIPLWKSDGKAQVMKKIKQKNPIKTIMIGDGIGDLMAGADKFIYFSGIVRRKNVIMKASHIITDLRELLTLLD